MIRTLLSKLQTLGRDERGLTTVEYAIVLCLIAALAVGAWSKFGGNVKSNLEAADGTINETLGTATSGQGQGQGQGK